MGSCFRSLIPLAVIYITIFHPKTQCMYCGFETMSAAFSDQTSNYWFILILYITALLYPFSQMAKSAVLYSGQFPAACRCNGMHACMAKWWESLTWINLLLYYNINMHDVYYERRFYLSCIIPGVVTCALLCQRVADCPTWPTSWTRGEISSNSTLPRQG